MRQFELFFTFIRLPIDYGVLLLAAISAYSLRFSEFFKEYRRVNIGLDFDNYFPAAMLTAFVWIIIFGVSGLYATPQQQKFGKELQRIIIACFTGLALIAIFIFLRGELFNSRFIVLAACGFAIFYVSISRAIIQLFIRWLYTFGIGRRAVVIIGNDETAKQLIEIFSLSSRFGVKVVKHFQIWDSHTAETLEFFKKKYSIHELVVTNLDDRSATLAALAWSNEHHIAFKYSADLFSTYAPKRDFSLIGQIPLIEYKRTPLDGWGKIFKRIFDFLFAFVLLIIFSPLLILISLIIFIESGRPIFFKNTRIGEHEKIFNVLKFRTMYQKYSIGEQFKNSKKALAYEQELIKKQSIKQDPIYKIKNDPRVTKFGRLLRVWSLDELPNFFNVLIGNMSIVGPRPHQPREVAQFKPHHKKVHAIKPGITGLAQISGRSELSFEKEIQLDTYYIEHWSIFTDLFIIIKTPFVVLTKKGSVT